MEGDLFLIFWREIYQNFGITFHYYLLERKTQKQKPSPFSLLLPWLVLGKEEIFSSISLLLAHLGIKGGDRETTLELGIHKAWSFPPFVFLGRKSQSVGASILVHFLHHKSIVSMIPPYFIFNIYIHLLYFKCLIFPWDK